MDLSRALQLDPPLNGASTAELPPSFKQYMLVLMLIDRRFLLPL